MASTPGFSTNTGISAVPEIDQGKDPELYQDALKIRNGIKILQGVIDTYNGINGEDSGNWPTVNPTAWVRTQNLNRVYAIASEAITQGAIVNLYNNSGVLTARNANATSAGKDGMAFANVSVASGAYGEYILQGMCYYIGGLTIGATYFLSNTNGLMASASGTVTQRLGKALGASAFYFNPQLV